MQQINAAGGSISITHYSYCPTGLDEKATERIACMPNMTEFHATKYHPHYPRSNDTRAVNCPACKRSHVFIEAKKFLEAALREKEEKNR